MGIVTQLPGGTVNSVDISGGSTGLTTSGGPITNSGTITLGGTLNAASGGTGLNTSAATNGQLLIGNGTGFTLAALTAGSGISITNSAGGISIAATGGGTGTVTVVSVTTANGVSGSVATATTTPAITLTLGAITPTSVAASGAVSGSNLSGTNTGDQTITLTSDVTGSGTGSFATTVAKIQGTTVSGTTGTTNVAFSASPTFTGTLTAATLTATGATTLASTAGVGTTIGNATGTLALVSSGLNVTTAGAVSGVTTLVAGTSVSTPLYTATSGVAVKPGSDSTTAIQLQNNAGTSILTVDTTNSRVGINTTPSAKLHVSGNVTAAAWTTNGFGLRIDGITLTDSSSSGTVTTSVAHSILAPTFAASSTTTYTTGATLYIADAPTAGTNVTITNRLALYVNSGRSRFGGQIGIGIQPAAAVHISFANSQGAWGLNGAGLRSDTFISTDSNSSGTVASTAMHAISRPTIAASSASTYTNIATLYIANAPLAGTNATITNSYALWIGAGVVRLDGGQIVAVRVVTAAGAVTVTTADFEVVVNKTVGAATTVNLPASPVTGTVFGIKDGKGDAATNNITVTPAAGTIDGAATYVMNVNYQANKFLYNGTEWNAIT